MRKAFIVPALLVIATFMVLCIGLLTRQPFRNQGAFQNLYQAQARQLAVSGVEEARLRLAGDVNQALTSTTFSRLVSAASGGAPVGSYLVTLDATWVGPPYFVMRVESEGFLGSAVSPQARYVIQATVDVREEVSPGLPNPDYLQLYRWRESVP